MIYVTIHTFTRTSLSQRDERYVTLALSKDRPEFGVTLLGNLEHCAKIVVDQKLVDDLQMLVNAQKEHV